jgi:hypothetical protein
MESASNLNLLFCDSIIAIISEKIKSGIKSLNIYTSIGAVVKDDSILAKILIKKLNEFGYYVCFKSVDFNQYFYCNEDDDDLENDYTTHMTIELNNCPAYPLKIVFMNHKD